VPTSAGEYRKARMKDVVLPSVLADGKTHPVFKIRKPSAKSLITFTGALGLELSEDIERIKEQYKVSLKTPEGQQKVSEGLRQLLVDCIVEPKVSLVENADALCVDEIDLNDQLKLLEAILETTGMTEEVKAARESFRKSAIS